MPSVMIIAAETSSCLYAERLIQHWKNQGKNVSSFGIGNQAMINLGFDAIGRSEQLAVVGIAEIVKHWSKIKTAFNALIEQAEKRKPDFILLLDYPEFNFKLAKKLKSKGFKVVYYISPQLWAWRKSRIKLVKKYIDRMLVLFPFEVDFYQKHDVDVTWVGHPLIDEIDPRFFDGESVKFRRGKYGIKPSDHVLGLMPGSRRSELKNHLSTQLQVAREMVTTVRGLKIVVVVAPDFSIEEMQDMVGDVGHSIVFVKDQPFDMISLCDTILVASGTATLMVGLLKKPMVIMYKMNWLSAKVARIFVKGTPYFGMVNLVAGKKVCQEYFQEEASVPSLVQEIKKLIEDQSYRSKVVNDLELIKKSLGQSGATLKVAEALEGYFQTP